MNETNKDVSILKNEVLLYHPQVNLIEMSKGYICCTLREELLIEVDKLAAAAKFD